MNGHASVDSAMGKIRELKAKQLELEEAEKYLEAEEMVHQIQEYSKQLQSSKEKETKQKQEKEIQYVQDSFRTELKTFTRTWDQYFKDAVREQNTLREKLIKRQEKEFQAKSKLLDSSLPVSYKPSSYLLALMKTKSQAARSKQYSNAESLKKTIENLKVEEQRSFSEVRSSKIRKQLSFVKAKFEKELSNFEIKKNGILGELSVRKNHAYEQLVKKFNNIKRELQDAQLAEINIVTGKYTNGVKRNTSATPMKLVHTANRFERLPFRSYSRCSNKQSRERRSVL